MALSDVLIWLSRKLLPTGRAFNMPSPGGSYSEFVSEDGLDVFETEDGSGIFVEEGATTQGGILYRLFQAIHLTTAQLINDGIGILNSRLPDNPGFTISDAHDWYRRLGIYDSGLVDLADMEAAITQKMSFPPVPINMQSLAFIQAQLQLAGFDVYLYQNRFFNGTDWVTYTPSMVLGTTGVRAVSGFIQSGQAQHGQLSTSEVSVCANYIEPAKDAAFDFGANLKSTFFIAGSLLSTFATVPAARQSEFRQLILKYKRCEMAAFLFVNYI